MQIDCPSCDCGYDVPVPVAAPGRVVRCAKCGHDWLPGGEALPPPPPVAPMPEPMEMVAPERFIPPAPPRNNVVVPAAWAASFLLLAGLGYGAVTWRQPIMHGWPPSARAYAAVGLRG